MTARRKPKGEPLQTKTAYSESTTYISRARSLPVGASVDTTFTRTGLLAERHLDDVAFLDGIACLNGLAVHCDAPGVRHLVGHSAAFDRDGSPS